MRFHVASVLLLHTLDEIIRAIRRDFQSLDVLLEQNSSTKLLIDLFACFFDCYVLQANGILKIC